MKCTHPNVVWVSGCVGVAARWCTCGSRDAMVQRHAGVCDGLNTVGVVTHLYACESGWRWASHLCTCKSGVVDVEVAILVWFCHALWIISASDSCSISWALPIASKKYFLSTRWWRLFTHKNDAQKSLGCLDDTWRIKSPMWPIYFVASPSNE